MAPQEIAQKGLKAIGANKSRVPNAKKLGASVADLNDCPACDKATAGSWATTKRGGFIWVGPAALSGVNYGNTTVSCSRSPIQSAASCVKLRRAGFGCGSARNLPDFICGAQCEFIPAQFRAAGVVNQKIKIQINNEN
jgi:hypothetical protein